MSGFGAGIRRGVMAGDQFTQIANGLFRDDRLSFRAKGLFGYISTHRDGWQVTVTHLARLGPDGRDAVLAGLKELEANSYLVRERVRRANGTLGEAVYSITDRPALALHVQPADSGSLAAALGEGREGGAGSGAGIRRGVMAGDQFTQIANNLFRDGRLSFKAKGLFGLLSTHREGWRMTVAGLARRGREGRAAVTSGLRELQQYGFLVRRRERHPDGTLAAAVYFLTDLPCLQSPRSQPESGYPALDEPTLANLPTKNTKRKKTNKQNTNPLPPRPAEPATRPTGKGTEHAAADRTPVTPVADELHPGIRLLLEIAAEHPELLLTGKALTDQGRVATMMLESGWSPAQLRQAIAGRPLPHPVRTSVAAIVAARLRAAQLYPPPAAVGPIPCASSTERSDGFEDLGPGPGWSSNEAAGRTVTEAITYRALVECAGCGLPGPVPGEDLCPACLGWPLCRTCPGPTPRRAHPDSDGRCTTCASAFSAQPEGISL